MSLQSRRTRELRRIDVATHIFRHATFTAAIACFIARSGEGVHMAPGCFGDAGAAG